MLKDKVGVSCNCDSGSDRFNLRRLDLRLILYGVEDVTGYGKIVYV